MNTHLWGWACVFSGSACSASAWAHCVRTPRTDDWRHLVFFWFICLTSFSLLLSSAGLVADIQAGKSSLQFPASVCTLYLHGRETTLITTVSGHQLLSGYFYLKLTWPLDLYSWEKGAVKYYDSSVLFGCIFSQRRSVIHLDALILQRYFVTHCLAPQRKSELRAIERCLVCV